MVGAITLLVLLGTALAAVGYGMRRDASSTSGRDAGQRVQRSPRDRYAISMGTLVPVSVPEIRIAPSH
jgi:hypothetical protein